MLNFFWVKNNFFYNLLVEHGPWKNLEPLYFYLFHVKMEVLYVSCYPLRSEIYLSIIVYTRFDFILRPHPGFPLPTGITTRHTLGRVTCDVRTTTLTFSTTFYLYRKWDLVLNFLYIVRSSIFSSGTVEITPPDLIVSRFLHFLVGCKTPDSSVGRLSGPVRSQILFTTLHTPLHIPLLPKVVW